MYMKAMLRREEMIVRKYSQSHGGQGEFLSASLLDGLESQKFPFMHRDVIGAGVSIGEHPHDYTEEIYYLAEGRGVLTFDGAEYDMRGGDISVCGVGHSHGFRATEDCVMIVVGSK